MYISIKLAPETEDLIEVARKELFHNFSFIASGSVISRSLDKLDDKQIHWQQYIPPKGTVVASLARRLNLTSATAARIEDLCKTYRLTKTEAIHTILAVALTNQEEESCRRPGKLKISSFNVNDFGGVRDHLFAHKTPQGKTDWNYWKQKDRRPIIGRIVSLLKETNSDVVFLYEVDINLSDQTKEFCKDMENLGYQYRTFYQDTSWASVTMCFYRERLSVKPLSTGSYRLGRDYGVVIGDWMLIGIHIPPKYDKQYWDKIRNFYRDHLGEKILILADCNTLVYDDGPHPNCTQYESLCSTYHLKDVWKEWGGDPIPTCGEQKLDYALASPSMLQDIADIQILHTSVSDHAMVIVNVKANTPSDKS